jgi:hypothetical protein
MFFGFAWLIVIVFLVAVAYGSAWGNWRIDNEGIEFRHCWRRKSRYLGWRNVDKVHWSYLSFGLTAGPDKLIAHWQWFPKSERDRLRSCLESCLSKEFDLRLEPPGRVFSFEPNFRSVFFWILRVLVTIVAGILYFFAVMGGGMLLITHYTDPHSVFGRILREWSAALALLLLVPLLPWMPKMVRDMKRQQRANPFWRVRGAPSGGLAEQRA